MKSDTHVAVTAIRWMARTIDDLATENSRLRVTIMEAKELIAVGECARAEELLGRADG